MDDIELPPLPENWRGAKAICEDMQAYARAAIAADRARGGEAVGVFMGRRLTPDGTSEFWGTLLCAPADDPEIGTKLFTRPAPAPTGQDAEQAAMYRWLRENARVTSEHWGGRWSMVIEGPAPAGEGEAHVDDAIRAAALKEPS